QMSNAWRSALPCTGSRKMGSDIGILEDTGIGEPHVAQFVEQGDRQRARARRRNGEVTPDRRVERQHAPAPDLHAVELPDENADEVGVGPPLAAFHAAGDEPATAFEAA